jgi:hypothetical protein
LYISTNVHIKESVVAAGSIIDESTVGI